MENKPTLRWVLGLVCLFIFCVPLLLDQKVSLLVTWLLVFGCWFGVIFVVILYAVVAKRFNSDES